MTIDERFAIAIVVMAAVTLSCRVGGLLIGSFLGENRQIRRVLDILPTCAIGAVIGPMLATGSASELLAIVAACAVFLLSSRFLLALGIGTAVLLLGPI